MTVTANSFLKTLGLVLLLALFAPTAASAREVTEINQLERRDRLLERMEALESDLGRQDPALIEVLLSLSDASSNLGLHSEASLYMERAIQLERLRDGLTTPAQIPLYFSMIEIDMRGEDWSAVNKSLDYLHWLLIDAEAVADDSVVDHLLQMSDFHLQAVAADDESQRARHYREASEFVYMGLEISEQLWGADDSRRLDLFYSLITQFYLQSAALELNDDTAYELRAIVPGSGWVRPKRQVQRRYYQAGLRLFNEMENILAGRESPGETLAMLNLYRADWHLLFNESIAGDAYSKSFTDLVAAGLDRDRVNALFSKPRVLPVARLHLRLAQAEADWGETEGLSRALPETVDTLSTSQAIAFREWFRDMPAVPGPRVARDQSAVSTGKSIWVRFELGPLNPVSRWVNGSYRSRLSVMENLDILGGENQHETDLELLDSRLHFLSLRPRIVDGKPQPFEGILFYQFAAE